MSIFRPYLSFAMPAMARFIFGGSNETLFVVWDRHYERPYASARTRLSAARSRGGPCACWSWLRGSRRGRFQYHQGGYARVNGPAYGIGVGAAAVATGALIGGAIASQNQGYYYPDQNYLGYPDQNYPDYSNPGYVYSDAAPTAYNNGGSVAYCEQTYRSYDPASGSYLGYDGFRDACP